MRTLQGVPASPGLAVGRARVVLPVPPVDLHGLRSGSEEEERSRLDRALEDAAQALSVVLARASGPAREILAAQEEMMRDPALHEGAVALIAEGATAEAAVTRVASDFAEQLESLPDPYLAARGEDIREAARRIVTALRGGSPELRLDGPSVLVAQELTPGDLLQLDHMSLLGIVSETGSPTGHLAIVAQGLGIPAAVGVSGATAQIADGNTVVLDGASGAVIAEPDEVTLAVAQERMAAERVAAADLARWRERVGETADGVRVEVFANIGSVAEAARAVDLGAEGVGLFRTEFIAEHGLPDEEEQTAIYRVAAEALGNRPLIVRTFDIGGDKPVPGLSLPPEMNPFLGLRGIRLALDRPEEVFLPQVRALLRAADQRDIRIMLPMVSVIEELVEARALIETAAAELERRGEAFRRVPVGIMVETPAAALTADAFAGLVDFVSIGTNDLTQYTYAADRTNPAVGPLAQPLGLAVLRLIEATCDNGDVPVAVCGRLAGEEEAIPILVGLGVRELSVAPAQVPTTKRALAALPLEAMRERAKEALKVR